MKTIAPAALAALANGTALVVGAVAIVTATPLYAWGGHWTLSIDGNDYLPLGDRSLFQSTGGALGGSEQNDSITLSGVEPAAIDLLDDTGLQWAPAILRRLIFEGAGTQLLDSQIYRRGRVDEILTEEAIGGMAAILAMIEGAARGLGRRGGRMRTDADQRLIKANDDSFEAVAFAGEKTLYWGGPRPEPARNAIGSGGTASQLITRIF